MLDEREKKIIFSRFGLDGGKAKTLEEVGKKFGVTRERIRQLQNIALMKLRRALAEKGEADRASPADARGRVSTTESPASTISRKGASGNGRALFRVYGTTRSWIGVEALLAGEHVADDDEMVAGFREPGFDEVLIAAPMVRCGFGSNGEIVRVGAPVEHELAADFVGRSKGVDRRDSDAGWKRSPPSFRAG